MTTNDQIRKWTGPALFSYGFRPFFLFGAGWAAIAMLIWVPTLSGMIRLPTRLDPVSWHAHEFLFGYLSAIIAGFLLTSVPNWTGRPPVVGGSLALLFLVWVLGRLSMAFSVMLPRPVPEVMDMLFLLLLGGTVLRDIIAGKNWRNLVVFVLLGLFTLANLLFHIEAARGHYAAQGFGQRLGVASVLLMISLIGGRVVPSFTRNWLVGAGQRNLPVPPMRRFDQVTMGVTAVALATWVVLPTSPLTGAFLIVMGILHLGRLFRWQGYRTLSEPLVWVLHLGYLFVPLGALLEGYAILHPDVLVLGAAQHLWMAGCFAMMTLGVMVRATLGHTGRPLTAGRGSVMVFMAIVASVALRISAGIWVDDAATLYTVSAVFWIGAFAGFGILHGSALLTPRLLRAS